LPSLAHAALHAIQSENVEKGVCQGGHSLSGGKEHPEHLYMYNAGRRRKQGWGREDHDLIVPGWGCGRNGPESAFNRHGSARLFELLFPAGHSQCFNTPVSSLIYFQAVQALGSIAVENRIKEGKNTLRWDKTNCHRFPANEDRLKMGFFTYNLLHLIRRFYLWGEDARRSSEWIITRLVKAGARIVYHARRWYVHVASAFPLWHHYRAVLGWQR